MRFRFLLLPVIAAVLAGGCSKVVTLSPTSPANQPPSATPTPTATQVLSSTPTAAHPSATATFTAILTATPVLTSSPAPASPTATGVFTSTVTPTPASAVLNDEIVFVAPLQAAGVPMPLYKVHPDGTRLSMVCNTLQCNDPCWSPDKTKVVFSNWGTLEICNADGSGLTQAGPIGDCPAWSPDGTRIAYITSAGQVCVMNANGTGATQITNDPNDVVSPQGLAWSPDSAKLAYLGGAGSRICNADGSGIQNLPAAMHQMQWSPDGTKFVFSAFQQALLLPSGNYENIWQIYVMNIDGSGLTQVSAGPDSYGSPCWSHDGSRILFVDILTTSTANMYIMNSDGSNCTLVPGVYVYPCYPPSWY